MTPAISYRRLPGASGFIFRKRLWLGPDHLLLVSSNVLSQEYRRFYFGDIQGLVVAEIENAARFYGFVLAGIAFFFTLGLVATGHYVWAVLCGLLAASLLTFAWTRPLVYCLLKTRVSTKHLSTLKNMEAAKKFALTLKAEIEKHQGPLPAEWVAAHPHIDGLTVPPALHPYQGGMHYAAFAAMFAVALLTPLRLHSHGGAIGNVMAGAHIGMVLFAVIAAVKQHGSTISRVARAAIALALAWAAVSYLGEQVIVATDVQAALRNPMSFDYWREPIWDVAIANAVAYTVFGIIGIFALLSHRTAT